MSRSLWTEFTGGWCDNCRIAATTKACPDCGQPMRPARIRIEPQDVTAEEWAASNQAPSGRPILSNYDEES